MIYIIIYIVFSLASLIPVSISLLNAPYGSEGTEGFHELESN